jgi:hypothetical protein
VSGSCGASQVTDFAFGAGQTLVYRADLEQDDVFELFAGAGWHAPRLQDMPLLGGARTR